MLTQFSRTELLLGKEAMDRLKNARVAVFGIGGVGGYVCEALVRTGVGAFDLIDDDKVCLTNLNRQIIATRKTVGKYKTEVMKERMLEINPDVKVEIHDCFFLPENAKDFPFEEYDYIVDAVDTVTAKIALVAHIEEVNKKVSGLSDSNNKIVVNCSQLSAATEEVTASAEQVHTLSEENLDVAKQVQNAVEKIHSTADDIKKFLH